MKKRVKPASVPRRGLPASALPLHYKVVELSTVDEATLEQSVNHWVSHGWNLENIQFAMRESSKRPAMAFVFFTRPGSPLPAQLIDVAGEGGRSRPVGQALQRLRELSQEDAEGNRE
jgi:hypothetical protein